MRFFRGKYIVYNKKGFVVIITRLKNIAWNYLQDKDKRGKKK